jgi:hypothetical protein
MQQDQNQHPAQSTQPTQTKPSNTRPYTSPYTLTTDCVLIKQGHDSAAMLRRVEPVHHFFPEEYRQGKGAGLLEAPSNAARCVDGSFQVQGSKIRHSTNWNKITASQAK